MAVFWRRGGTAPGTLERRTLSFIAPPIGAHIQTAEDFAAGSVEGAMRHMAVWKCVRLISDVVSCMQPVPYRGQRGVPGAKAVPAPPILTAPSAGADISDFVYMAQASLLLRGNAWGQILERDQSGFPTQIELQHPDHVSQEVKSQGQVVTKFGSTVMMPDQIWHKMAYRMPGMHKGLSPVSYARATIRQSMAAQRFATDWFDAGGHPGGILKTDAKKTVDQKDAKTIKERFLAASRSREPVVMGNGWDYTPITINPEESQFLSTQKYTGAQVCGLFGVQPELVGEASEGSSITYANVESRSIDFMKFGLSGWIHRWERWLGELIPRGQYVKLDARGLLQSDTLTWYQAIHMLVAARIITQDEARAILLELPPLTPEQRDEIDALIATLPPAVPSPKIGS